MKTLKIILLTVMISFLIFALSVFIILKFFLTPAKINHYLGSYIEKSIGNKSISSEIDNLNDLYGSDSINYKYSGNEFDDIKKLEKLMDISQLKDIKLFDNLSDLNFLSSQLSSNINMKMDLLKYKMTELLSKNNIKEE